MSKDEECKAHIKAWLDAVAEAWVQTSTFAATVSFTHPTDATRPDATTRAFTSKQPSTPPQHTTMPSHLAKPSSTCATVATACRGRASKSAAIAGLGRKNVEGPRRCGVVQCI